MILILILIVPNKFLKGIHTRLTRGSSFFRNLAGNSLETLESGGMESLGRLAELNLAKNRINSIAKDAFIPLTNLEKL